MRRFTDESLSQIEAAYKAGGKSLNALAKELDIPEPTLRRLVKKNGWVQDAPGRKRKIVSEHFAGVSSGMTNKLTNDEVRQRQEAAALEDISDMQAGLDVARACIRRLGDMVEDASDPRDIKVIVDANKGAIETIRKIRGLDEKDSLEDIAKKFGEGVSLSSQEAYLRMCNDVSVT